jgi:hypothetical protein
MIMGLRDMLKGKDKGKRGVTPNANLKAAHTAVIVRERGAVVSLAKTGQGTISLRKGAEAALDALTASGMLGIRAKGRLWIDRSGSMHGDFKSGAVLQEAA